MSQQLAAVSGTSQYDTVHAARARRSMRRAAAVDTNNELAAALHAVCEGVVNYAATHQCAPEDVDVNAFMTTGGRIVLEFSH